MTIQDQIMNTIATRILNLETLEERRNDSLDFHDLAVWNIRRALEAAFLAGHVSATKKAPAELTHLQHFILSTAIKERDGKLAWFPEGHQEGKDVRRLAKQGFIFESENGWWVSATGYLAVENDKAQ